MIYDQPSINWYEVAALTLWILGLSELLATLGFAHGLSEMQSHSMRHVLSRTSFRLLVASGIVLFALGLMLTAATWWEKIGWGVVIALSLCQLPPAKAVGL